MHFALRGRVGTAVDQGPHGQRVGRNAGGAAGVQPRACVCRRVPRSCSGAAGCHDHLCRRAGALPPQGRLSSLCRSSAAQRPHERTAAVSLPAAHCRIGCAAQGCSASHGLPPPS
eukprot:scaffold66629_cov70-Phaeocystis_antarctica.AAC.4